MSEFIGYVGVLHEINSENSSVALENVKSYGTEGRKQNPEEEIPASDNVYEYIVFRGSDVKDLRIEEAAKENKPPPQVPNDPAILGAGSRPQPQRVPQNQPNQQFRQPQQQSFPQQQQFPPGGYPPFPQNPRFGPPGGPHGFPGAPGGIPSYPGFNGPPGGFGGPPGWGAPGQGFPNQGPFSIQSPPNMPIGPPGQHQQDQRVHQPPPIGTIGQKDQRQNTQSPAKPQPSQTPDTQSANKATDPPSQQGPPPPIESKPDAASALAPPPTSTPTAQPIATKTAPTGPRGKGGIIPVVPLAASNISSKPNVPTPSTQPVGQPSTETATAAVAAAMAKLTAASNPPATAAAATITATVPSAKPTAPKPTADGDAIQHLAQKVSEMRTDAHARQGGRGSFGAPRGRGRGRGRGGHDAGAARRIEVPSDDFDFESANKKFNKQDLVKEAIASGSPLGGTAAAAEENGAAWTNGTAVKEAGAEGAEKKDKEDVVIPGPAGTAMYNRASSFFDDISSDLKDREESKVVNGREMRSEERKKNFETFGQGSVDGGAYRGGFRGRGRGRGGFRGGRGYRGGGGGYRGRGGVGASNGTAMGTGL
ncbi:MAG: hypothetical protein Q9165_000125 [Trypethelium subeluteriae]